MLVLNSQPMMTDSPLLMGIINVTPDSFAISCRSMTEEEILEHARAAIDEGADILDIGGYSTRPGAESVSVEQEWERVEKALRVIRKAYPEVPISVDTFRAEIARKAVEQYGVEIINDISGGELDEHMFETVADTGATYILMHMRGTPETMSQMTQYDDMMSEILHFFAVRIDRLHQLGVKDIILDPGFGFAKTLDQNYELLRRMDELKVLGLPILAGVSRKSMIYKLLGTQPTDEDTLRGTTACHMVALMKGATVLRVHDVRAGAQSIYIYKKLKETK